jgi:tetratricopeptide (TPR) repeat protein
MASAQESPTLPHLTDQAIQPRNDSMPSEFKHVQAYQHIEKGQHLESLGLLDEAMLEFKRAVEADPRIAAAHNSLGHHYRRKGLLTKASDEFRSAVLLNQDYESCFNLGRVLTELEQYAEAAELYQRCLTLDSEDPSARYELGYALCGQLKFPEALTQFQALVDKYPEDWELKFALADCHMGLKDHATAERELVEALKKAPPSVDTTAAREALLAAWRHQEFPAPIKLGWKDLLYAEYGVMGLGSSRDDGIAIPIYESYDFTHRDIAVTLSRFLHLVREHEWRFTAVASMDADSLPIALALSQVLEAPTVQVEELREDDFGLLVLAIGKQPELCDVTLEHVSGRMLSLALALTWPLEQGPITDLVGVQCASTCTLPWQRMRKRMPKTAATSLLRALATGPEESNQLQQVTYYTQSHKLLRFFDHSARFQDLIQGDKP